MGCTSIPTNTNGSAWRWPEWWGRFSSVPRRLNREYSLASERRSVAVAHIAEATPYPRNHSTLDCRRLDGCAGDRRFLSVCGAQVRLRAKYLGRLGVLRLHGAGVVFQELQPLGKQHRPDGGHDGGADLVSV